MQNGFTFATVMTGLPTGIQPMDLTSDRRQFQRINFDRQANLTLAGQSLVCEIIDLSLHGALVNLSDSKMAENSLINQTGQLTFHLGDKDHSINMTVTVSHHEQQNVGLECTDIDLDSISHLRRMIELNTGDSQLLKREFAALLNP